MVKFTGIAADLAAKIESFDPLKAYRRQISNRKTHVFIAELDKLKASIYQGIRSTRSNKNWKPTVNQDKIVTEAILEYINNLYKILSSPASSKFSYSFISRSATGFKVTVTGDGDVEAHIQRLRSSAGLNKVSNKIKNAFGVNYRKTALDLGHLEGSTVAEKYASEILSRFESVGFKPKDKDAYEELKTRISYDPRKQKLAVIEVEDQYFGVNQSTTEEAYIQSLLLKVVGDFAKKESLRFLNPLGHKLTNEIIDISARAGAKVPKKQRVPGPEVSKYHKKKKIPKQATKITQDKLPVPTDVQAAPEMNWSRLLPVINASLYAAVANNMRAPALVFRTGRFARSVEVTRVDTTQGGYPSIVYNYQREPYDVFDKALGALPWNTPSRDPKTLIDKSIRDIMRGLVTQRFYTRRQEL